MLKKKRQKKWRELVSLRNLEKSLPRHSFIIIYKSFVRPHLENGDIIYEQPNNESCNQKIERIQYNAGLAITGAIKKHLTK